MPAFGCDVGTKQLEVVEVERNRMPIVGFIASSQIVGRLASDHVLDALSRFEQAFHVAGDATDFLQ